MHDADNDGGLRWWQETARDGFAQFNQDTNMPKLSEMLESKYLKQADVDGEVPVTFKAIKRVNVARDDEEAEYKWTALFHEFDKPLVMNPTNLKRTAKALGDDTDDWIGNSMILYVDPDIEFGGNVVGGLRLRAARNPAAKAKAALSPDQINRKLRDAEPQDDVPFN